MHQITRIPIEDIIFTHKSTAEHASYIQACVEYLTPHGTGHFFISVLLQKDACPAELQIQQIKFLQQKDQPQSWQVILYTDDTQPQECTYFLLSHEEMMHLLAPLCLSISFES